MQRVWLSLGSNIDRETNIVAALDALEAQYGALECSSVYESESVGFKGDPFLNLVVGLLTDKSVGTLSSELKAIENLNGRDRSAPRFSGRTLDIDILTYGSVTGDVDGIRLPREEVTRNAFVLRPLAELAPDELHPLEQKSYRQLWTEYDRQQALWPVSFLWKGRQLSTLD